MRGGKPVLLPNWWSPPGPESESAPVPESESEAGSGLKSGYLSLRKFLASAADALQDSRCGAARVCHGRDAGLSPGAWNTIREAIGRDTPSGPHRLHAFRKNRTRSAAGTFSGHRQCSRRICHQKCGCRVSPTTSGSSRSTRDRAAWRSRSSSERLGNQNQNSLGLVLVPKLSPDAVP